MHPEAYDALKVMLDTRLDPQAPYRVLDAGGMDVNSSLQGFDIPGLLPRSSWTVLDVVNHPLVDVVADIRTWKPEPQWDVVVSTEMLEHLENWERSIPVMASALRGGGPELLVITCAGPSRPLHDAYGGPVLPEGQYYQNISPEALQEALEGVFNLVEVTTRDYPSDVYAVAQGVKKRQRTKKK